jgi:muramidase (phage lysozyme)
MRLSVQEAGGPNVCAFLDMIAHSEIGDALLLQSDDGYDVLVGSLPGKPLKFHSYAQHPQILNAALNSTAAGRYQFIRGTWAGVAGQLNLTDFSPVNQDRGCIELIRERQALDAVKAGAIEEAITLCSKEWASLPGAGYGQRENRMADLVAVWHAALQKYARPGEIVNVPPGGKSLAEMIIEFFLSLFK